MVLWERGRKSYIYLQKQNAYKKTLSIALQDSSNKQTPPSVCRGYLQPPPLNWNQSSPFNEPCVHLFAHNPLNLCTVTAAWIQAAGAARDLAKTRVWVKRKHSMMQNHIPTAGGSAWERSLLSAFTCMSRYLCVIWSEGKGLGFCGGFCVYVYVCEAQGRCCAPPLWSICMIILRST